MSREPLISLILPVKDGLPHLERAVEAVRSQTYRHFELIVQDGGSKDGSLQYLQSLVDVPGIDLVSEPDAGIGQAYNRGLTRARGDLICFLASDEQLRPRSLERLVTLHLKYPRAASIYGDVTLVGDNQEHLGTFVPHPFDLAAFLRCELFPTTAGVLNRSVIGRDLFYDESLRTCPDYDFWIRLGARFGPPELVIAPGVYSVALKTRASASYRFENFEQFCSDKAFILDRYLDAQPADPVIERLRISARAGILLWAAECTYGLEGASDAFLGFCRRASALEPYSPRLRNALRIAGKRLD